jgi:hypothetical protein
MLWAMRILGVFNLLFVGLGLCYALGMLEIRWGRWPGPPSLVDWAMIILYYAISLACLALQVYTGVKLIKGHTSSLRLLGMVFVFIILYVLITTMVDWSLLPHNPASKAIGFWEGGVDPLDPQFFTGFPLLGGITVLLLLWKRRREAVHV